MDRCLLMSAADRISGVFKVGINGVYNSTWPRVGSEFVKFAHLKLEKGIEVLHSLIHFQVKIMIQK